MLNLNGLAELLTFGFTLDGKTMIQEKNIPSIPMSIPKPKTNANMDDVYAALDEAMEKLIEAKTGLALSGGLDSRINAGIAAEIEGIPTFTFEQVELLMCLIYIYAHLWGNALKNMG